MALRSFVQRPYRSMDSLQPRLNVKEESMQTVANGAEATWIVCLGAERPAIGGIVRCPTGGNVDFRHCLDCRLLETSADERHPDRECDAGLGEAIG